MQRKFNNSLFVRNNVTVLQCFFLSDAFVGIIDGTSFLCCLTSKDNIWLLIDL